MEEYFTADSTVCQLCHLQEQYVFRDCRGCEKAFQSSQLRENADGSRMCHDCAPQAWPYRCTACTRDKPASEFRHSQKDLEQLYHRRCRACETCAVCHNAFTDHRCMAPDTRLCTTCVANTKLKTCSICENHGAAQIPRLSKAEGSMVRRVPQLVPALPRLPQMSELRWPQTNIIICTGIGFLLTMQLHEAMHSLRENSRSRRLSAIAMAKSFAFL